MTYYRNAGWRGGGPGKTSIRHVPPGPRDAEGRPSMIRFGFVPTQLARPLSTLFFLGAAVLAAALFSGAIQPGPALADPAYPQWDRRASATASGVRLNAPSSCPATPVTVLDPADDSFFGFGFGPDKHEITSVVVDGDATTLCLTVNLAGEVDPA